MADITTENVSFPANGRTVPGYLARPSSGGPYPGMVVVQEWWGLDDHIKDIVRRFASEGYCAVAPDLYYGKVTSEPNEAMKLAMDLDRDRAVRDIIGALQYLKSRPETAGRKLGMIGYCMGGRLVWAASLVTDLADAGVAYYGSPPEPVESLKDARPALLGIFAGIDRIPASIADEIKALFTRHDKRGDTVVYPDARHGFFNDTRPDTYHEDASADAWKRTLEFLETELKEGYGVA